MWIKLRNRKGFRFVFRTFGLVLLLAMLVNVLSLTGEVKAASSQASDSQKKLLKKARKQLRKGLLTDSANTLKRVLAIDPGNHEAKLDLAYVFLKQRRLLESYDHALKVAEKDSKNAYAFAILGSLHLVSGDFREARVFLNNSLILNKREALAWASLGMLEFYSNRVRHSILNLKRAVYHNRREADFEFALAQVSARGERYKEAAKSYERFLRIAPVTDTERRDRIRGLIGFLKYLGKRPGLYTLAGKSSTTVKTKIVNNRPVVPIRFKKNGEVLNFVLDTGSGITVVSEETAKRFKIRPVARGGVARALGGSGKFNIVYGFLGHFLIGDVRVRNVPVYIRKFQPGLSKVDGYIGLSLISKFITTVDYENGMLSLVRKNKSVEPSLREGSLSVPLRLTSSGFLSGNVRLPGVDSNLHFILDTGASVSVVSEDLANRKEVLPYLMEQRMRVIGAAGITDNVPTYMLRDVGFGGTLTRSLRAVALDLDIINETAGFKQEGILGGNFLKDYKLTFDFKRSRVTLVPN